MRRNWPRDAVEAAGTPDALKHTMVPRLLLAEDDAELRKLLADDLRTDGWDVLEAADGQALHAIARDLQAGLVAPIHLVITDVRMPGPPAFEAVEQILARSRVPVLVMTGFLSEATFKEARRLGALGVFHKPFDVDDLCTAASCLRPDAAQRPRPRR